jgi:hypothetical protein
MEDKLFYYPIEDISHNIWKKIKNEYTQADPEFKFRKDTSGNQNNTGIQQLPKDLLKIYVTLIGGGGSGSLGETRPRNSSLEYAVNTMNAGTSISTAFNAFTNMYPLPGCGGGGGATIFRIPLILIQDQNTTIEYQVGKGGDGNVIKRYKVKAMGGGGAGNVGFKYSRTDIYQMKSSDFEYIWDWSFGAEHSIDKSDPEIENSAVAGGSRKNWWYIRQSDDKENYDLYNTTQHITRLAENYTEIFKSKSYSLIAFHRELDYPIGNEYPIDSAENRNEYIPYNLLTHGENGILKKQYYKPEDKVILKKYNNVPIYFGGYYDGVSPYDSNYVTKLNSVSQPRVFDKSATNYHSNFGSYIDIDSIGNVNPASNNYFNFLHHYAPEQFYKDDRAWIQIWDYNLRQLRNHPRYYLRIGYAFKSKDSTTIYPGDSYLPFTNANRSKITIFTETNGATGDIVIDKWSPEFSALVEEKGGPLYEVGQSKGSGGAFGGAGGGFLLYDDNIYNTHGLNGGNAVTNVWKIPESGFGGRPYPKQIWNTIDIETLDASGLEGAYYYWGGKGYNKEEAISNGGNSKMTLYFIPGSGGGALDYLHQNHMLSRRKYGGSDVDFADILPQMSESNSLNSDNRVYEYFVEKYEELATGGKINYQLRSENMPISKIYMNDLFGQHKINFKVQGETGPRDRKELLKIFGSGGGGGKAFYFRPGDGQENPDEEPNEPEYGCGSGGSCSLNLDGEAVVSGVPRGSVDYYLRRMIVYNLASPGNDKKGYEDFHKDALTRVVGAYVGVMLAIITLNIIIEVLSSLVLPGIWRAITNIASQVKNKIKAAKAAEAAVDVATKAGNLTKELTEASLKAKTAVKEITRLQKAAYYLVKTVNFIKKAPSKIWAFFKSIYVKAKGGIEGISIVDDGKKLLTFKEIFQKVKTFEKAKSAKKALDAARKTSEELGKIILNGQKGSWRAKNVLKSLPQTFLLGDFGSLMTAASDDIVEVTRNGEKFFEVQNKIANKIAQALSVSNKLSKVANVAQNSASLAVKLSNIGEDVVEGSNKVSKNVVNISEELASERRIINGLFEINVNKANQAVDVINPRAQVNVIDAVKLNDIQLDEVNIALRLEDIQVDEINPLIRVDDAVSEQKIKQLENVIVDEYEKQLRNYKAITEFEPDVPDILNNIEFTDKEKLTALQNAKQKLKNPLQRKTLDPLNIQNKSGKVFTKNKYDKLKDSIELLEKKLSEVTKLDNIDDSIKISKVLPPQAVEQIRTSPEIGETFKLLDEADRKKYISYLEENINNKNISKDTKSYLENFKKSLDDTSTQIKLRLIPDKNTIEFISTKAGIVPQEQMLKDVIEFVKANPNTGKILEKQKPLLSLQTKIADAFKTGDKTNVFKVIRQNEDSFIRLLNSKDFPTDLFKDLQIEEITRELNKEAYRMVQGFLSNDLFVDTATKNPLVFENLKSLMKNRNSEIISTMKWDTYGAFVSKNGDEFIPDLISRFDKTEIEKIKGIQNNPLYNNKKFLDTPFGNQIKDYFKNKVDDLLKSNDQIKILVGSEEVNVTDIYTEIGLSAKNNAENVLKNTDQTKAVLGFKNEPKFQGLQNAQEVIGKKLSADNLNKLDNLKGKYNKDGFNFINGINENNLFDPTNNIIFQEKIENQISLIQQNLKTGIGNTQDLQKEIEDLRKIFDELVEINDFRKYPVDVRIKIDTSNLPKLNSKDGFQTFQIEVKDDVIDNLIPLDGKRTDINNENINQLDDILKTENTKSKTQIEDFNNQKAEIESKIKEIEAKNQNVAQTNEQIAKENKIIEEQNKIVEANIEKIKTFEKDSGFLIINDNGKIKKNKNGNPIYRLKYTENGKNKEMLIDSLQKFQEASDKGRITLNNKYKLRAYIDLNAAANRLLLSMGDITPPKPFLETLETQGFYDQINEINKSINNLNDKLKFIDARVEELEIIKKYQGVTKYRLKGIQVLPNINPPPIVKSPGITTGTLTVPTRGIDPIEIDIPMETENFDNFEIYVPQNDYEYIFTFLYRKEDNIPLPDIDKNVLKIPAVNVKNWITFNKLYTVTKLTYKLAYNLNKLYQSEIFSSLKNIRYTDLSDNIHNINSEILLRPNNNEGNFIKAVTEDILYSKPQKDDSERIYAYERVYQNIFDNNRIIEKSQIDNQMVEILMERKRRGLEIDLDYVRTYIDYQNLNAFHQLNYQYLFSDFNQIKNLMIHHLDIIKSNHFIAV